MIVEGAADGFPEKIIYNLLKVQKIPRSTFIQQALIDKLAFSENFRRQMLSLVETQSGKDWNYYNLTEAFKSLDKIKKQYTDATDVVARVVKERIV